MYIFSEYFWIILARISHNVLVSAVLMADTILIYGGNVRLAWVVWQKIVFLEEVHAKAWRMKKAQREEGEYKNMSL